LRTTNPCRRQGSWIAGSLNRASPLPSPLFHPRSFKHYSNSPASPFRSSQSSNVPNRSDPSLSLVFSIRKLQLCAHREGADRPPRLTHLPPSRPLKSSLLFTVAPVRSSMSLSATRIGWVVERSSSNAWTSCIAATTEASLVYPFKLRLFNFSLHFPLPLHPLPPLRYFTLRSRLLTPLFACKIPPLKIHQKKSKNNKRNTVVILSWAEDPIVPHISPLDSLSIHHLSHLSFLGRHPLQKMKPKKVFARIMEPGRRLFWGKMVDHGFFYFTSPSSCYMSISLSLSSLSSRLFLSFHSAYVSSAPPLWGFWDKVKAVNIPTPLLSFFSPSFFPFLYCDRAADSC
jgi:hypothetical protein